MGKQINYPFEIRPLSAEEGGGFLISYPDFSECLSDGETVEEALLNGKDALKATIAALKAKELPIPAPNSGGVHPESSSLACQRQSTRGWLLAQRLRGYHSTPLSYRLLQKVLAAKNVAHSYLRMGPNRTFRWTVCNEATHRR